MLVYDHFLTFSQEVERIWKQRISVASFLFLFNRYGTPIQFIILLDAFHDPHWTKKVCNKFVIFEGAATVTLMSVGQLIMILRVFAVYERNRYIFAFLITLWFLQVVISAVGLHTGFAVPLPTGLTGCILTGKSALFPSLWIAPLITDSAIFFLTIYRTKRYLRFYHKSASPTITVLIRDGALYFLLIFLANLMNTLIYFLAEPDLKAIGASFSQLLTSTMISRLVLNLRSASSSHTRHTSDKSQQYRTGITFVHSSHPSGQSTPYNSKGRTNLWARTLGNLDAGFSVSNERSSDAEPAMRLEVLKNTEVVQGIPGAF